ncbi:MAG: DUF3800 domain-containing protein [Deltaproteobacteria bacterium]|nr:DUF3800 domain-containing protein [Deltaproteobacteria bacterium]
MYFFYLDESGSRGAFTGSPGTPKDHLYVLAAVGMYEGHWFKFDREVSLLKLELAGYLERAARGRFDLADCEVKSNWIRHKKERERRPFLGALDENDLGRLVKTFYAQVSERNTTLVAVVVDKRFVRGHVQSARLQEMAYEFLLERIESYMGQYHPKHHALIVMDDTGIPLNRIVAMRHATLQRRGNQNLAFRHIVEYPFFTRSELSNGIQLADLVAYDVYRAFRDENLDYPFFKPLIPHFYRGPQRQVLDGLKVWPEESPLVSLGRLLRVSLQQELDFPREDG